MKAHTTTYKEGIKQFGRELDSKITYTLNGETIELGGEELNSITPHYEGNILKSIMRQLDIDSNVEIPKGTILNYQFGIKVGDSYEYVNYGNYVVYKVEKQEDSISYTITCYDKMLYSMVDYENLNIQYPISVRDYIKAICDKLGLVFANEQTTFANYDKMIESELFLDENGNSLEYKFRDVLDQLAEVTASTICINETTDELEIRYINDIEDTIDEEYLKDINVKFGEKYGPINSIVLSRSAESDNIYLQDEDSVAQNGLCEVKISDNQFMNFDNRDEFLPDILEKLDGLEYYINDYSSTGITYYDVCDKYNVKVGENTYPCVMFNNQLNVTQGLSENVYTDIPESGETDYSKADKTDRRINKATLIVKKTESEIEGLVSSVNEFGETIDQVVQNVTGLTNNFIKNGGTNLFYNTGLHFKDDNDNFTYWVVELQDPSTDYLGVVNDSESLSGTNMILPRGKVRQTINITPGTYSFSFSYRQNLAIATCSVTINNKTIQLESNTEWTQIDFEEQQIEVINNTLTIEFECNVQGGYYIKELMLNRGTESMEYAQNINETRTDTVQISDGILVTSSSTNTESRHDSDGFRILRKDNKEVVLRATENGTETTSIKASSDSEIAGLLIKKYQGHVLMSGKGDD